MLKYFQSWIGLWNQFWFVPSSAQVLSIMRIAVGSMLLYTHLVWTFELETFFSAEGILPSDYRGTNVESSSFAWSHFDWLSGSTAIWISHFFALAVFAMFMAGLFTRITSVLAFLLVVSYANRATGTLFGLDQINAFLTLYLAISNCGQFYSIDSRLRSTTVQTGQGRGLSVCNTIATRLIQLHLCIVYLFAGLGKLQGTTWWNGEAIWGTLASYEYQTMDMTWLCEHMWLINLITYVAVAWEVSYAFLIWPRLTRPLFLSIAVLIHLGIGMTMGMMTFGLIMLYANLAFIEPEWLDVGNNDD